MTGSGLELLTRLATVDIHQKTGGGYGNEYTVDSEGKVLFYLKEDGQLLGFLSNGKSKGFRIHAVDTTGTEVFMLHRPSVFMSDKVKLYMNDTLVSVVRKKSTFNTPIFSINDAQDSPIYRIKGNSIHYDFQLQTTTKTTIGGINKKFGGLLKETLTYKDDYVITFPADLDVCFKLTVIGACVLIDYRYHEG